MEKKSATNKLKTRCLPAGPRWTYQQRAVRLGIGRPSVSAAVTGAACTGQSRRRPPPNALPCRQPSSLTRRPPSSRSPASTTVAAHTRTPAAAPATNQRAPPPSDLRILPGRRRIWRPMPPPTPRTSARAPTAPVPSTLTEPHKPPSSELKETPPQQESPPHRSAPAGRRRVARSPHHPREIASHRGKRASLLPSLGSARIPGGRPSGGGEGEEGGRRARGGGARVPRVTAGGDAGKKDSTWVCSHLAFIAMHFLCQPVPKHRCSGLTTTQAHMTFELILNIVFSYNNA